MVGATIQVGGSVGIVVESKEMTVADSPYSHIIKVALQDTTHGSNQATLVVHKSERCNSFIIL